MAKAFALLASALCFLAVAAAHEPPLTHKDYDTLCLKGQVYCDGCRVLFNTGVGGKIGQAEVELLCRDRESGNVTLTVPNKTDNSGYYQIFIDRDHENDICSVRVVSSPLEDCNEIVSDIASNWVNLAKNNGIVTNSRFVNPIGFVRKEALPECHDVLDSMGFIPQV